MAKTSSFLFTNSTDQTVAVTPKKLGLASNYAVERDTARRAQINNKTAPIDAQEIITFSTRDLDEVTTDLPIGNPARVKKGILYRVDVQDTLVTVDSDDPTFRVDEPIVASLQIRHGRSGNITAAIVAQVVTRLISACRHDNGDWRFEDLMRSAERPVLD